MNENSLKVLKRFDRTTEKKINDLKVSQEKVANPKNRNQKD